MPRSPRDVVEDHLARRQAGDLHGDLKTNYHPDVVLLSAEGISRGRAGVRNCNRVLREHIPEADYVYLTVLLHDEVGYIQWRGEGAGRTFYGADTFVVRDGRIVVQTIHFHGADSPWDADLPGE